MLQYIQQTHQTFVKRVAARGTSRIRETDFIQTKTPDPSGHYIITGRGMGRVRL